MVATALDNLTAPPSSSLGWHLLDARPKEAGSGSASMASGFCNPAGFVQGGILSAMLDDTMGPAVFVMTEGRLYTATITMTVNFLSPARPGPITARRSHPARQDHCLCRGQLMAEDGTLLATATTSARLVETAKAIVG